MSRQPARVWEELEFVRGAIEFDRLMSEADTKPVTAFSADCRKALAALDLTTADIDDLEDMAHRARVLSAMDIGRFVVEWESRQRSLAGRMGKLASQLHDLIDGAPHTWQDLFGIKIHDTGDWADPKAWAYEVPALLGQLERLTAAVSANAAAKSGRRGKQTRLHALRAVVIHLEHMLCQRGFRRSTAERSKMVRALRVVCDDLQLAGDPRDILRSVEYKRTALAAGM